MQPNAILCGVSEAIDHVDQATHSLHAVNLFYANAWQRSQSSIGPHTWSSLCQVPLLYAYAVLFALWGAHSSLLGIANMSSTSTRNSDSMPTVQISIGLEPTEYSFSSNEAAPTLTLTAVLHADKPITVYDDGALNIGRQLREGRFRIYDATTGEEVQQRKRRHCIIPPPKSVQVPLRKQAFVTLYPGQQLTRSTMFSAREIPKQQQDADADGNSSLRTGFSVGVDGLFPEHRYRMVVAGAWQSIRWWQFGDMDAVLNHPEEPLDARKIAYGTKYGDEMRNKSHWAPHPEIKIDGSQLQDIFFNCIK